MKLVLTKTEVLEIVLKHVQAILPQLNHVEFERYVDDVVVSYEVPTNTAEVTE